MLSTKTALEEKIRVSNERDEEYKLGKKGPESQDEKAGVAFLIYNYITQDKNLSRGTKDFRLLRKRTRR